MLSDCALPPHGWAVVVLYAIEEDGEHTMSQHTHAHTTALIG